MVKVVSLFDGISCGYMAMLSAGVEVTQYVAYEIDKYAIKASSHNFPDIVRGGDVFKADFTQHAGADFVIGGSPCTYWSIAQSTAKREVAPEGNGWELFKQYLRAIDEIKPRYFIYENNKSMAADVKKAISQALKVEPVLINSALVSAQFRQRYYWVGVLVDGEYRQADIPQPRDRGVLLKDVLDGSAMADKSHAIIGSIGRTTAREYFEHNQGELTAEPIGTMCDGEKAITLKAQYSKNGVANFTAEGWSTRGATGVCVPVCVNSKSNDGNQPSIQDRIYSPNGKSPACTQFVVNTAERVGQLSEDGAQSSRIYSPDGKSTTLNAGGGGGGAKTGLYAIPASLGESDVYQVEGGYITTKKGHRYPVKLEDGYYKIRKLSVAECKRLQTVPEWFDLTVISPTQAYKCLGNGWTVEVIAHLIRHAMAYGNNRARLDYWASISEGVAD